MLLVKQILERKGRQVWSVAPEVTVFEALKLMAHKNVGALAVVAGDQLVGIFSERDYARKVVLLGKSSKDVPVSAIMTGELVTVGEGQTVQECMQLMTSGHLRHLPVLNDGKLVGMISIGDVVKELISQQQFEIEQLESYIKQS